MEIKTLELSGYIYLHGDEKDAYLIPEKPNDEYYYPEVGSIGDIVAEHFSKVSKQFDVSLADWTKGVLVHYKDVFVQYYLSKEKIGWNEVVEEHIRRTAGDLTTQQMYSGYSEYTVTDSWVEMFVGGHDLRKELMGHEGEYVNVRISYKVNV